MTLPKLNVIFPMAGDGMRFGGVFKPFQQAGESYFIELAKYRFDIFKDKFSVHYYLIFRQDQEEKHGIKEKFQQLFPTDTLTFCIIPEKTAGPLQTVINAMNMFSIEGPSFICDCDLSVNLKPFIERIYSDTVPDYIVSLYNIPKSSWFEWGKAIIDSAGNTIGFCEKEDPSIHGTVLGLVGCHYINNLGSLQEYSTYSSFSHCFQQELLAKKTFGSVTITEAHFFGTPEQLTRYKLSVAQKKTFFIDIDGTLIYTTDPITYDPSKVKLLPGTLETLQEYKRQNHIIVLTTARKNELKLINLLSSLQIPYDKLITNISSGQRILINDKKPYFPLLCMAVSYQPDRDVGISGINGVPCPTIIKKMYGCSAADVYLLEVNGTRFIRKYIKKSNVNTVHYENLKRQLDEIRRFSFYWKESSPKILNVFENNDEFYYDMEYLEQYVQVSSLKTDEQYTIIESIFKRLFKDVYCYRKHVNGTEWLVNYLNEKITPRISEIESFDEIFSNIINSPSIIINGKAVRGLRNALEQIDVNLFIPTEIQPIHGDLTLENILYCRETADIKLIDHSGSKYMDSFYLDLGKVFQSVLARYEEWRNFDLFQHLNKDIFILNEFNLDISSHKLTQILVLFNDYDNAFCKGVFYMITHLIRAIPYLYKKDKQKALYTLLLTCWYLSILEGGLK
jgi:hypothetical protein